MRKAIHSFILCCLLCFLFSACGGDGGSNASLQNSVIGGGGSGGGDGGGPVTPGLAEWSTGIYEAAIIARGNPVFGFQLFSSPAIAADGTIYVGSTDNKLYALGQDGTVKWVYETGDQIVASPAIGSDGTVYIGSADRQLYAISPDGTLKWVYPTKTIIVSSAALATDGTIYVAGPDLDKTILCSPPITVQLSTFYAMNPNGTLKWSITLSGPVNSSPTIASDGTIYIGSDGDDLFDRTDPCNTATAYPPSDANTFYPVNGHVYAINPDGTLKWDFRALGDVDSSAAIASDGTIYIGSDYATKAYGADPTQLIPIGSLTTGFLYSINPNGTPNWVTDLFGDVKSSPAIGSDGTIYVGSDKEDVFAINADGTIKWVFPTLGPVRSSPALATDGTIYIGSNDSSLYVLNPDGTEKFSMSVNASVASSPAIIEDGTVYFATGVPVEQDTVAIAGPPALYAIFGSGGLADTAWPKFRRDLPNTGRQ